MQFLARTRAATRPQTRPTLTTTTSDALTPTEVRRGLRLSIIEGSLANIHISVTAGAFATGFALLLGARDFELGVMGALPFIGQLFQFVGAYLEERFGERKPMVLYSSLISRVLWVLIAALPFMAFLGSAQLALFLIILAASQALLGITSNAWTSWMCDLVPPRQRGRYFGTRNTIASVTAMASTWLAGRALDHYRGVGDEATGYAVIFGGAVLFALASSVVLHMQPEPPTPQRSEPMQFLSLFSTPLRHARFRSFAFACAGWALVTGIAAPFFNAYGIQNLHMSFQTIALTAIVTSGVALFSQPLVGRFQDRFGDKAVLIGSAIGVVLIPWGWVLARPDFLLPVWVLSVLSGVFWPGITQGLVNLLMDRAPVAGRGAYLAAYAAINGAGTFAAALLGGVIASGLAGVTLHLGALAIGHYAVLFIITSIGRAVMVGVFVRRL